MNEEAEWNEFWKKHRYKKKVSAAIDYFRRQYNHHFKQLLRKNLTQESTIVELGCGSSSLMLLLHNEVKAITCVDFSKEALAVSKESAKKKDAKNMRFVEDDCRKLKHVKPESFDLVWSQGLLEHFEQPEIVLAQHLRICKPGGKVIISVPAKFSFSYAWYCFSKLPLLRKIWPWVEYQNFYRISDLHKIVKKLGYAADKGINVYYLKPIILGILIMEIEKSMLQKKSSKNSQVNKVKPPHVKKCEKPEDQSQPTQQNQA